MDNTESKGARAMSKPKRKPQFECLECSKKFYTVKAAERAYFGIGCPKCGGADIGEYTAPKEGA